MESKCRSELESALYASIRCLSPRAQRGFFGPRRRSESKQGLVLYNSRLPRCCFVEHLRAGNTSSSIPHCWHYNPIGLVFHARKGPDKTRQNDEPDWLSAKAVEESVVNCRRLSAGLSGRFFRPCIYCQISFRARMNLSPWPTTIANDTTTARLRIQSASEAFLRPRAAGLFSATRAP